MPRIQIGIKRQVKWVDLLFEDSLLVSEKVKTSAFKQTDLSPIFENDMSATDYPTLKDLLSVRNT
jgi:hypothetical protein